MKIYILILFCFLFINSYSQVGKDCSNPLIVTSLPFNHSGTTNGFGMDYQVGPNGTTYMTGNDFVFKFQPTSNIKVSIFLTGTNSLCGLFIANNCPDAPGVSYIAYAEAPSGNPTVANIQLYSDTAYYIIIDTYNAFNLFPSTPFNINIINAFQVDLAGGKIDDPITSCNLTNNQRFVLRYSNTGVDTVFGPSFGYIVNNDPEVFETTNDTILPGVTYYYTFNTHYDLSQLNKTYNIKMFTSYTLDTNRTNDTIFFPIVNNETINTFPYLQDFELDSKGWSTAWLSHILPGTSWRYKTPDNPIINYAASGSKCWVTDTLDTYLQNESSYIIGPCFDFSALTLPVFDLDIWYETDVPDMVTIEYTTENTLGPHWHQLGNPGEGTNWYNTPIGYSSAGWNGSSGGWVHARHTLDTLGGKPYVQFRITFIGGNNTTKEGVAIDNINISESPFNDLSLDEIIYPTGNCNLSATDSIIIKITNHGMNAVNGFEVKCSTDNGNSFVTEIVNDTLNFLDSIIYKFNNSFDFSNNKLYNVIALTNLTLEQNKLNDTAKTDVMHYASYSSYPFFEDFETSDGTWFPSGTNSSWQWGIPADTALTTAASGNKIWATNLSGYHNFNEHSVITSPCYDFTNLTKPKIKFQIWFDETYPTYCQFKSSIDGGNTFQTLGSAADVNWYNAGYSWTYSSNGWINVENQLNSFVGKPDVRFQFAFEGAIENTGFAFDSIIICEMPTANFSEVLSKGWQVQLSNSSLIIDSCLWNFGDGTFSNILNPLHTYPSSDSVLVTLTVYNSCGSDSIKKFVHPKYVSIDENVFSNNVSISPNPANSKLLLKINSAVNFPVIITIYNLQGEIIKQLKTNQNETTIDINSLNQGVFGLKISGSNINCFKRFIKIK